VLTKGRISQIEKRAGEVDSLGRPAVCSTSEEKLVRIARVLRVSEKWLRGEDVQPIQMRGWRMRRENLSPPPGAPSAPMSPSNLRRWLFAGQCLDASRRDYTTIEGGEAAGEEWAKIEQALFPRFFHLPELAQNSTGLTGVLPAGKPPKRLSDAEWRERWERYNRAAMEYWSLVLQPWWDGTQGFNYYALLELEANRWIREARISPRVILRLLQPPKAEGRS
jgi:hypothetical protein